jgi:hypothetical protein
VWALPTLLPTALSTLTNGSVNWVHKFHR